MHHLASMRQRVAACWPVIFDTFENHTGIIRFYFIGLGFL